MALRSGLLLFLRKLRYANGNGLRLNETSNRACLLLPSRSGLINYYFVFKLWEVKHVKCGNIAQPALYSDPVRFACFASVYKEQCHIGNSVIRNSVIRNSVIRNSVMGNSFIRKCYKEQCYREQCYKEQS